MSLLSKLFGSRPKPAAQEHKPEEYNGFTIIPTPIREGSRFRLSARIEKGDQMHSLIRADMLDDEITAISASIAKAKRMIDEQGDRLFGTPS
ncbi:HlyU family transcriptional regulator [Thioclava sp. FR2]|uniref:HlyU family transcriptional regulator n=1 Tax=Thioclava sp. FR2 TaxID=3445780 RepID=UPI003EBE5E85